MRVHVYNRVPRRKRYQFGDRREIGGVTHVRCRVFDSFYKAWVVNSDGSPKVDWVPEKDVDFGTVWPRRKKS